MIDEKMLSELKPYIEECLKFGNYPQTHPEDMLELIRLARLGLWAETHGYPVTGSDCGPHALICVRHPIMRDEACATCWEAKDRNDTRLPQKSGFAFKESELHHPGLKETHERYERFWRDAAHETMKICDQYSGTRYASLPGASWWQRLRVRFLNWRSKL